MAHECVIHSFMVRIILTESAGIFYRQRITDRFILTSVATIVHVFCSGIKFYPRLNYSLTFRRLILGFRNGENKCRQKMYDLSVKMFYRPTPPLPPPRTLSLE